MRTGIALASRRFGSAIRPGHAWGAVRQARAFSTAPETVEKRHNRFPELGGANQIFPGAPSPLQEFSVVYTDRAVREPPRRAHRNAPPPRHRPPPPFRAMPLAAERAALASPHVYPVPRVLPTPADPSSRRRSSTT